MRYGGRRRRIQLFLDGECNINGRACLSPFSRLILSIWAHRALLLLLLLSLSLSPLYRSVCIYIYGLVERMAIRLDSSAVDWIWCRRRPPAWAVLCFLGSVGGGVNEDIYRIFVFFFFFFCGTTYSVRTERQQYVSRPCPWRCRQIFFFFF